MSPTTLGGTGQHRVAVGRPREVRYRRTTMRVNRLRHPATGLVVLAALLGTLWAGGLAAPASGEQATQLTGGATLPWIEPAVPPDRVPALRPSAERPDPGGRLTPLLLGLLVASVTVAYGVRPGRLRSSSARARPPTPPAPVGGRAPPHLQPA